MNTQNNYRWDWFLIETEAGMMLTAKVEIIARGVEFLLPMTWRREMVDGRYRPVPEPRLPGRYAFVRLPSDPNDPNNQILNEQADAVKRQCRGVRDVYKNARGQYAVVQKWEIQALKDADAEEHREAGKAKPKFVEPRYRSGTKVRVLRHNTFSGQIGEFLFSVRGLATVAMDNGIKLPVPDCDLSEVESTVGHRLAG